MYLMMESVDGRKEMFYLMMESNEGRKCFI